VAELLRRASETRSAAILESEHTWSSYAQAIALFEAAAAVLDDHEVGRRIGEQVIQQRVGTPIAPVLRALGSPAELCREITRTSAKFQTVGDAVAIEIDDTHAVIAFTLHEGFMRNRLHCDYMVGLLSQIPVLFSQPPAEVVHDQCQVDGADRCVYTVAWPGHHDEPEMAEAQRTELLEAHNTVLSEQIQDLQSTAADLVSADDVATVLARIAARAAAAVRAPRYVLALWDDDGRLGTVHSQGLTDVDARAVASRVLSDEPANPSWLVVDVVSAHRRYGRLAALYDQEGRFFPAEVGLLGAYARHAAAALGAATALEDARRREETASGLLAVARTLSNVVGGGEVGATVAASVPGIVGCDRAVLFRWDGGGNGIVPRLHSLPAGASHGERDLTAFVRHLSDTPALMAMSTNPVPCFFDAGGSDVGLGTELDRLAAKRIGVVPVIAIGELLGLLVVVWDRGTLPPPEDQIGERLSGIADQVATALRNADLLQQVRHQALHDALTGLPNQVLFTDRTDQALAAAAAGQRVAVMFLDLDRFKRINDSLGHAMGNELLCRVSERLLSVLRDVDTLARWGGDEFAVLLPAVSSRGDAVTVAQDMRAAFVEPFRVGGMDVRVTASIGIAISPDDGTATEVLLKRADLAMYRAKTAGRNGWCFSAASELMALGRRLSMETELATAIAGDGLTVRYEPQVDLDTGRVVGIEALVRWPHPEQGLLLPDQFIGMAEDSGLIVALDEWVMRRACTDARAWRAHDEAFRLAVNVSGRHFEHRHLHAIVESALHDSGLDPRTLELEVTESRVVDSRYEPARELAALRRAGVRIAIDDFGTGASVLSRLHEFPFDTLKIDQFFVAGVGDGATGDAAIVAALISMAKGLAVDVVAEGVETPAQLAFLRRHGCQRAQGYLFSKPVPAEEVPLLLASPFTVTR
jgi:diguanylate cyclase (GGDEF)-like protein